MNCGARYGWAGNSGQCRHMDPIAIRAAANRLGDPGSGASVTVTTSRFDTRHPCLSRAGGIVPARGGGCRRGGLPARSDRATTGYRAHWRSPHPIVRGLTDAFVIPFGVIPFGVIPFGIIPFGILPLPPRARAQDVTEFAAASSPDAIKGISAKWMREGHDPSRMSFGSGSILARQIEQGAPAHVPVGNYAEQALKKRGMWDSVSHGLARTGDVRAGLPLMQHGQARAGVVYATDAAAAKAVMIAGTVPADSYDSVAFPFAVTKSGDIAEARALLAFPGHAPARAMFTRRGFKVE